MKKTLRKIGNFIIVCTVISLASALAYSGDVIIQQGTIETSTIVANDITHTVDANVADLLTAGRIQVGADVDVGGDVDVSGTVITGNAQGKTLVLGNNDVLCHHFTCTNPWTVGNNWSIVTSGIGKASFGGMGGDLGWLQQGIGVEAGKYYTIQVKIDTYYYEGDDEGELGFWIGGTCAGGILSGDPQTTGTFTYEHVQATNTDNLKIYAECWYDVMDPDEAYLEIDIDYITVKEETTGLEIYAQTDIDGNLDIKRNLTMGKLIIPTKSTAGDPLDPSEGQIYTNTADNKVRTYTDGAWRTLLSW